ncbi:MAG TPA: chemotaxis protein CheB [Gemmataceae bacterium]|jgi:two-component system chemotaxis response regulator CheB|nr:chemotaxis protein CheB [Gemmataceae bacterium]
MAARDIIVIGTSTGGVEALAQLARGLPPGFPASLFVVCHFPPGGRSILPDILSRSGPLLATHARDGEVFQPGHVYVAPPDYHLLLGPDRGMVLNRGARENHFRPAVDPLFRSAAREYGNRVIGVILTGAMYDGTAGLIAVRAAGGVAVVQDPRDAVVAAMPQNATEIAGADHVVPVARMAPVLADLVTEPVSSTERTPAMDPIERMPDVAARDMERQANNERRGEVSTYTCPECGGSLWQVDEAGLVRFRCHVGHAYNGEALLAEQSLALEAALWTAVRTFKEKSVLARQLAVAEVAKGDRAAAGRFAEQAEQAREYSELIQRHVLTGNGQKPVPGPGTT